MGNVINDVNVRSKKSVVERQMPSKELGQTQWSQPGSFMYVLDCGSWLTNLNNNTNRSFGVISGKYIVLGMLIVDNSFRHNSSYINQNLKVLFKSNENLKKLFWVNKNRDWNLIVISCTIDSYKAFCQNNELYVFIPDMHICLGKNDPLDFLARDIKNVKYLLEFLTFCKTINQVIIIQLGDLFDIWVAEAKKDIYYKNPCNSGNRFIYQNTECRDRTVRLKESAERIAREIEKNQDLIKLLKLFDYYIVGNHDYEMIFNDAWNILSKFLKKDCIKIDKPWPQKFKNCDFEIFHGHMHDKYNSTLEIQRIDDVMHSVKGKGITFSYSRSKRNEYLCIKTVLMNLGGPEYEYLKDEFDSEIYDLFNDSGIKIPFAIEDWFENRNFGKLRKDILCTEIINDLEQIALKNKKDYKFKLQEVDNNLINSYRYIFWYGDPKYPPELPESRIIVHSHTHLPMLTKVTIKWKK